MNTANSTSIQQMATATMAAAAPVGVYERRRPFRCEAGVQRLAATTVANVPTAACDGKQLLLRRTDETWRPERSDEYHLTKGGTSALIWPERGPQKHRDARWNRRAHAHIHEHTRKRGAEARARCLAPRANKRERDHVPPRPISEQGRLTGEEILIRRRSW